MIHAHRIVDALHRYRDKLIVAAFTRTEAVELAGQLQHAEKFEFVNLAVEPDIETPGGWHMPSMTREEMKMWDERLIPLPAPLCYFEFQLWNGRVGLIVREIETGWFVRRTDFIDETLDGRGKNVAFADKYEAELTYGSDHVRMSEDAVRLEAFSRTSYTYEHMNADRAVDTAILSIATMARMAMYFALMLLSRTSEVTRISPSARDQKERRRMGWTPKFSHTVVDIVPERFQYMGGEPGTGPKRRSPRLHWKRSHLRHFDHQTDQARWAADLVHNGVPGWWVVVVPRCLVGSRELGEISHEYRIESPVVNPKEAA